MDRAGSGVHAMNIVLVTPIYSECLNPAGLYTEGLAKHLIGDGHRVIVLCAHAWAPRPGLEANGRLRVHRLSCRRSNLHASFGMAASHRLAELCETQSIDAVIDIDAREFRMIQLARSFAIPSPVPARSITISELEEREVGSYPVLSRLWNPPVIDHPTLLAMPRDASHRASMIDAYRSSSAPRAGWSLSVLEQDGSWTTIDRVHAHGAPDAVLIAGSPNDRFVQLLASEHGIVTITDDPSAPLKSKINSLISEPKQSRHASAHELWQLVNKPEHLAARSRFIQSLTVADSIPPLARWRSLEYAYVHPQTGVTA